MRRGQKKQRKSAPPRRTTPYAPITHEPPSPKPPKRDVAASRLNKALARLADGWILVRAEYKDKRGRVVDRGWRLVSGLRTLKVRLDVVIAIARLIIAARGKRVTL